MATLQPQASATHIGQAHKDCGNTCRTMGSQLALPVAILHAFAFGLGYWMCRLLGFNEKTARTVSIETGAGLISSPALCPPFEHLSKIRPMTSL